MNILILGAGFAGVHAAVHLSRRLSGRAGVGITLVDVNNYHLFKPMLHEVATASVDRTHIQQPIRHIMKGRSFSFVRGMAHRIDTDRRQVHLCEDCSFCTRPETCALKEFQIAPGELSGDRHVTLAYDTLVVALGGAPNYYGIPGAREHAIAFNRLEDAERLRQRVLCAFEIAGRLHDPEKRRRVLSFAVVGAGPTGMELASDLHDWIFEVLPTEFGHVSREEIGLYLVEAGPDVLPNSPAKVREAARKQIRDKSIVVLTGNPVVGVGKDYLETGRQRVPTRTVIWAAGVEGNSLLRSSGLPLDAGNRVRVNEHLNVVGYPDVFAMGDCSAFTPPGGRQSLPQTGQVAVQEASYLARYLHARILARRTKPFHYRELGSALSTGRHQALASFLGILRLHGILGWLAWKATYLKHLLGVRLSVRSLLHWFFDITYDREAARHKF